MINGLAVVGPIGSGKSTLAKALAEGLGVGHIPEPYERFLALEEFYQDPKRWAYHVQSSALYQTSLAQRAISFTKSVGESLIEASEVYVSVLKDMGHLTEAEVEVLYGISAHLKALSPIPRIIYLRTPAEVCYERVQSRQVAQPGRAFEEAITLDYLTRLVAKWEKVWVGLYPSRLTVIDGSLPANEVLSQALSLIGPNPDRALT